MAALGGPPSLGVGRGGGRIGGGGKRREGDRGEKGKEKLVGRFQTLPPSSSSSFYSILLQRAGRGPAAAGCFFPPIPKSATEISSLVGRSVGREKEHFSVVLKLQLELDHMYSIRTK